MSKILTVTVPDHATYEAYDYGYGEVLHSEFVLLANNRMWVRYTVAYESEYHAQCQADRFMSGLYGASVFDNVR